MTGAATGTDRFVFGNDGGSIDTITDFDRAAGDLIDVTAVTHDQAQILIGDFDGGGSSDDSKVLLTQGAGLNATIIVLGVTDLTDTDFIGL